MLGILTDSRLGRCGFLTALDRKKRETLSQHFKKLDSPNTFRYHETKRISPNLLRTDFADFRRIFRFFPHPRGVLWL